MHDDKIWAMDFSENLVNSSEEKSSNLMMITGGSDSKIKLWQDSTAEEERK
jgi:hypothetical protein